MFSRIKSTALAICILAIGGTARAAPAVLSCPSQHDALALSGLLVSLGPAAQGQSMEPDKQATRGSRTILGWNVPAGPGTLYVSCEYGPIDQHATAHDIERPLPVPGAAASCSEVLRGQAVESASCRQ